MKRALITWFMIFLLTICAGSAAMAAGTDPLAFSVTTLDGKELDSSVMAEYDLVMMNYWAEWCGPCMGELPELERIHQQYPNVLLLGAYVDRNDQKALKAAASAAITYPLFRITEPMYDYLEIQPSGNFSIPQTCFFDREGNMIGEPMIGVRDYDGWAKIVEEMLEVTQKEPGK